MHAGMQINRQINYPLSLSVLNKNWVVCEEFGKKPSQYQIQRKIRQGRHGDDNRCVCATFCCEGAKTL